jgi:hypothetical protein
VPEDEPAAEATASSRARAMIRSIRAVTGRMCEPDLQAQCGTEECERVVDVVPVSDERDDEPARSPNRS